MMNPFLTLLAVVAAHIAAWFSWHLILAWLVSTLVSFLFAVEFGFWKAFAAIVLLGVFSRVLFSGIPRVKSK